MYPKAPIFTSPTFGDAWWTVTIPEGVWVCEYFGVSLIVSLQSLMFTALRPPFATFNGTETQRVRIDGTWGPQTFRGLWAYAKKINAPAAVLQVLQDDAERRRISDQSLRIAIWLLFYQPRPVDLTVNANDRDTTTREPLMSLQPINNITLAPGAVPPVYMQRPPLPTSAFTTLFVPICTPKEQRDQMSGPPQPVLGVNTPVDASVPGAPAPENAPGASVTPPPAGSTGTDGASGTDGTGGGTLNLRPTKSTSWLGLGLIALGVAGLGYAIFSSDDASPRKRAGNDKE